MLKHKLLNKILFVALLALPVFVLGSPQGAQQTRNILTFGIFGYIRSPDLFAKFGPFKNYIEEKLIEKGWNVEVRADVYSSYDDGIDALARGELDLTRFGPVSYVKAKSKNPNIKLLAMEDNFGKKYFEGVIFVNEGASIQTLDELKGLTVAFGDENSTTGRYLPQLVFKKLGLLEQISRDMTIWGSTMRLLTFSARGKS